MSFQQGLSGLNGASKQLDVIGNNIANSSTVGFKSSQAQFSDIYATSFNNVVGNTPGIGVQVAAIAQQFAQGGIENSGSSTDIAIDGGGFFRTVVDGAVQYSRNGQFTQDKLGFLVNAQGAQLTGYLANSAGVVQAGNPVPIQIDRSALAPQPTKNVALLMNLDSRLAPPANTPFNVNDPLSYSYTSPAIAYDSLGVAHRMDTFYVKAGPGTWTMYTSVDNAEVTSAAAASAGLTDAPTQAALAAYYAAVNAVPPVPANISAAADAYGKAAGAAATVAATAAGASASQLAALLAVYTGPTDVGAISGATPDSINAALLAATQVPAKPTGTLVFNANGALDAVAMAALTPPTALPLSVSLPVFPSTGATSPMLVQVSLTGTTQFASKNSSQSPISDGYAPGAYNGFSIAQDGTLLGQYTNGKTLVLGQIVLANFANPNGLQPLGNNAWSETSNSGSPLVGVPQSGGLGTLYSNAVETSNVDLTNELVNMITAQRAYQANAQTIKTQDSILQTLVNLR